MSAEVRRLFLALWPDSTVRRALVALQRRFSADIGRPVGADDLHLTLVFLGATPAARQQCLERAVGDVHAGGFELRLDCLGHWRKPEVLWAGGRTPAPLMDLVQRLQTCVSGCGGRTDERPFEAHLTLFRKVRRAPRPLPPVTPISWRVASFVMVESVTAADGARYRVLREWPLGGSTSP
jgi:2'-5' RNA ligase